MQILIGSAKTMGEVNTRYKMTTPHFIKEAENNINIIKTWTEQDFKNKLKINGSLAKENYSRFQNIDNCEYYPALLAYQGMVFKNIQAEKFTKEEMEYAQKHIIITSFLYGLLRPLDSVSLYRLEGKIKLHNDTSMFNYWKPILTDYIIKLVKKDDNCLINLASNEMTNLFDWDKIKNEVNLISPDFTFIKNGKAIKSATYAKMTRGQIVNYLISNKLSSFEEILKNKENIINLNEFLTDITI